MSSKKVPSNKVLTKYQKEMAEEVFGLSVFWSNWAIDEVNGGFFGSVNNDNIANPEARKGLVLNSRILWAFSAVYQTTFRPADLQLATRAFDYLTDYFIDEYNGGMYWSVDHEGNNPDTRKQIYGIAFCIYGMSEYHAATRNPRALAIAQNLYGIIENKSWDERAGGYGEAFNRDWSAIKDVRLSDKDHNEKFTANTHLHIIEAYTNLYRVWNFSELDYRIEELLGIFHTRFINPETGHLNLFFNEKWELKSSLQSYGHDIEAAWLLLDCAKEIGSEKYIPLFEQHAKRLTDAAKEGLDKDGGLWYELDPEGNGLIKEKHSWPQAEAMVGFFNAWEITQDPVYLDHSLKAWKFVKKYLLDDYNGEWFWGVNEDYSVMQKDKVGFWKCPYHSMRACLEIESRLDVILKASTAEKS